MKEDGHLAKQIGTLAIFPNSLNIIIKDLYRAVISFSLLTDVHHCRLALAVLEAAEFNAHPFRSSFNVPERQNIPRVIA